MTKTDIWMPLYVADYLADTLHLTTLQHGAYLLLLMHHWRHGDLPDDDAQLSVIARLTGPDWLALAPVIREFFTASNGRLRQKRLIAEMDQARINKESRTARARTAAAAMHAKRRDGKHAPSNPSSMLEACPSPSPSSSPSKSSSGKEVSDDTSKKGAKNAPAARKRAGVSNDDPDFVRFWNAYPRKVRKAAARKAWATAITKAAPDSIIAAVQGQWFDPRERYQPHPATWLNGEQWADEASGDPVLRAVGLNPESGPKPGFF